MLIIRVPSSDAARRTPSSDQSLSRLTASRHSSVTGIPIARLMPEEGHSTRSASLTIALALMTSVAFAQGRGGAGGAGAAAGGAAAVGGSAATRSGAAGAQPSVAPGTGPVFTRDGVVQPGIATSPSAVTSQGTAVAPGVIIPRTSPTTTSPTTTMTPQPPDGSMRNYRMTTTNVAAGDQVVIEVLRPLFASAADAVSASPAIADGGRLPSIGGRANSSGTSQRSSVGANTSYRP